MWQQDYGPLFANCSAIFDPQETVRRHAAADLASDPRYLTNFLGVRIDPKFFPGILDGRAGEVEPLPLPANWHADLAEWAAALRAVDFARSTFRAIELGCGWACWLNCTGAAARRLGLEVELIGVEGDSGHVQFAHESLDTNGFSGAEYRIIHGIAAARAGKALFPNAGTSGMDWGAQPVFGAGAAEVAIAKARGSHHVLDMIPFSTLAGSTPVDLLHIDIQGGEAELVQQSLPELNRLVRRMVIGTHSRAIEGALMDTLTGAGWILEIERPAIYRLPEGAAPVLVVDGLQGWANPRL
jgi:hypothetical protein